MWLGSIDAMDTPGQLQACLRLLTPDERSRARRFRFERDQRREVFTRAMVRCCLSFYADRLPAEWRFAKNQYGCPAIGDPLPPVPLHFNVSHSGDRIACAVVAGRSVGIDLEDRSRRVDIDVIAPAAFHARELAALRSLRGELCRRNYFFAVWTLKEAYIKARRMGLSTPLDQFYFEPLGVDIGPFIEPDCHDAVAGRWVAHARELAGDYALAVVAERRSGSGLNVRVQLVRTATEAESMPILPGT